MTAFDRNRYEALLNDNPGKQLFVELQGWSGEGNPFAPENNKTVVIGFPISQEEYIEIVEREFNSEFWQRSDGTFSLDTFAKRNEVYQAGFETARNDPENAQLSDNYIRQYMNQKEAVFIPEFIGISGVSVYRQDIDKLNILANAFGNLDHEQKINIIHEFSSKDENDYNILDVIRAVDKNGGLEEYLWKIDQLEPGMVFYSSDYYNGEGGYFGIKGIDSGKEPVELILVESSELQLRNATRARPQDYFNTESRMTADDLFRGLEEGKITYSYQLSKEEINRIANGELCTREQMAENINSVNVGDVFVPGRAADLSKYGIENGNRDAELTVTDVYDDPTKLRVAATVFDKVGMREVAVILYLADFINNVSNKSLTYKQSVGDHDVEYLLEKTEDAPVIDNTKTEPVIIHDSKTINSLVNDINVREQKAAEAREAFGIKEGHEQEIYLIRVKDEIGGFNEETGKVETTREETPLMVLKLPLDADKDKQAISDILYISNERSAEMAGNTDFDENRAESIKFCVKDGDNYIYLSPPLDEQNTAGYIEKVNYLHGTHPEMLTADYAYDNAAESGSLIAELERETEHKLNFEIGQVYVPQTEDFHNEKLIVIGIDEKNETVRLAYMNEDSQFNSFDVNEHALREALEDQNAICEKQLTSENLTLINGEIAKTKDLQAGVTEHEEALKRQANKKQDELGGIDDRMRGEGEEELLSFNEIKDLKPDASEQDAVRIVEVKNIVSSER